MEVALQGVKTQAVAQRKSPMRLSKKNRVGGVRGSDLAWERERPRVGGCGEGSDLAWEGEVRGATSREGWGLGVGGIAF